MTKTQIMKIIGEYGYKVIKSFYSKSLDSYLIDVYNEYQICEIYISKMYKKATIQTYSTSLIFEPVDISDWFWN